MSVPGAQVQQAGSVRIPKRFPLVARPGFRSTTLALVDPTLRSPVSDAALFNCYAELDPEDNQYWVGKRPGYANLHSTGLLGPQGVGVVFGQNGTTPAPFLLAAFNGTIFSSRNSAGAWTAVPFTGTGNALLVGRASQFVPVQPQPTSNAAAVYCANGNLWVIDITPGPGLAITYSNITSVSGGTFPATAPVCDGAVFLDQVVYVMDYIGNIWGSNANDLTTWAATTVIKAGGRYDFPVTLVQQLEYVIALKTTSGRCFYNAGAAAQTGGVGSNLAWVEGADFNYGCVSASTVQLIDQTLVWVSNNDKGSLQVVRMDGLQIKVISTPPIERLLQQIPSLLLSGSPLTSAITFFSSGIKRGGHRWYVMTSVSYGFTIVYDLDQEIWTLWSSPGDTIWHVAGVSANQQLTGLGQFQGLLSQTTLGDIVALDIDQVYPADAGVPGQVDIYTPNWDAETRRIKQLNAQYWVNDRVSGSFMQVRKSDDDYGSWSPFREVSLSVPQPSLTRCGSFRRRAQNIRHNAAVPFRIKASELQLDVGTL